MVSTSLTNGSAAAPLREEGREIPVDVKSAVVKSFGRCEGFPATALSETMPSLPVFNYRLDHARASWRLGFRVNMGSHLPPARDRLNHHASTKAITRAPRIAGGR
jgi:hypothetical protein